MVTLRANNVRVRASRSPELAQRILASLTEGFALSHICSVEGFSYPFFYDWLKDDPQLAKDYARAREIQAEMYAEKTMKIAEEATPETANVARLQVDTIKWYSGKIYPKKYGEKAAEMNFNQVNNFVVLSAEKQAELQERRRRLLEG